MSNRSEYSKRWLESVAQLIQVVAVVAGVVLSVLSFNAARQTEAGARQAEARARQFELQKYEDQRESEAATRQTSAAQPFIQLRQKIYLEVVQVAAVLANPKDHSEDELTQARKRFRQLYVAELALVESSSVETNMVGFAANVDPQLLNMTMEQKTAYILAHALRDSLIKSWGVDDTIVDYPNR